VKWNHIGQSHYCRSCRSCLRNWHFSVFRHWRETLSANASVWLQRKLLDNRPGALYHWYHWGKTFGNKGVCSAVFLDIAQAFDRVWHRGLHHKLRSILPYHFYLLLKPYLTNRYFRVKHEDSYSELKLIKAGVPRGSVLGSVLYLLYINDVPTTLNSTMARFADDTAVMAIGETVENSTRKLQSAQNKIVIWTKQRRKTQWIQIGRYWLY
jgi:hypothetical protein